MRFAPPISDALRRGATILAANARAARALHLGFAHAQLGQGRTVWPTPPIHDWQSWLRDLWRDYAFSTPDAPLLLTPLQEHALWTRSLRDEVSPTTVDSFAALAAEAWSLLSAYQAHAARRSSWGSGDPSSDAQRFRHWAAAFERDCNRHRWLSPSQLQSALTPHLASLSLPPEILLVGFDRIPPAQQSFLDALAAARVTVTRDRPEPAPNTRRDWVAAADRSREIAACAAWARDLLLENPAARIGVLVGSLASLRHPIDRTFRSVLMPQSDDILLPSLSMPYEFSLGEPLSGVPVLRAALLLLRWIAEPLRQEEISWLLLSGFVADTVTMQETLARHDARLRRDCLLSPERSIEQVQLALSRDPSLRLLYAHLGDLMRVRDGNQVKTAERSPSAWTDLVHTLLAAAGWPGLPPSRPDLPSAPASLRWGGDSIQFQALQRWLRLLDEVALLDFDGTRCAWDEFLKILERHTRETIFSPESHHAPIQILGPFESSGQQFDALWFMGTDDRHWPQHDHLQPLLPPAVQRQYAMPHSAPDDDWNLAHTVTSRLLASAPHIVFSYAERDAEAEFRPSPLIAGLFPPDSAPQPAATTGADPLRAPHLEEIADDSGILPWPVDQTAGGAGILTRQAACPFQSFAAKRLAAEPLDAVEWGLDPAEKGKLLHAVLQRLFDPAEPTALHTNYDLVAAIATKSLAEILHTHIDTAVRALLRDEPTDSWQHAWIAVEKQRLHDRLLEWLALEARRQPFTVEACEKKLENVAIGGLRLNLRADRIDLLPDGSRFILDYKSGNVSASAWDGERPGEPQLPLYAAYGNVENVSGVLLAKIRAGETGFDGRVRDARAQLGPDPVARKALLDHPFTGPMRDEWARALENLAAEFLQGEAAVRPREPQVCKFCDLHALCRVAELDRLIPEDDAQDDDKEDADA
ncbi:MAG TPA: PD-(D/E)XK nuclease family protein [Acidobacteriaceae bacterium]|jgi:probable DNA repair protein|nr:PD-(D/E)XK nuclease family protein [Acidobacteriaceae bacterium]